MIYANHFRFGRKYHKHICFNGMGRQMSDLLTYDILLIKIYF